jgi:hypothetical protein
VSDFKLTKAQSTNLIQGVDQSSLQCTTHNFLYRTPRDDEDEAKEDQPLSLKWIHEQDITEVAAALNLLYGRREHFALSSRIGSTSPTKAATLEPKVLCTSWSNEILAATSTGGVGITYWVPTIGIPGVAQQEAHIKIIKDTRPKEESVDTKPQNPLPWHGNID